MNDNVLRPSVNRPQAEFLTLGTKFRAFVAGYGCVEEGTEILTAKGFRPISEVKFGDEIVSWNERNQKFQLSQASGGFPKGKASLYRVVTTRGEFVASGHHRICVSPGIYLPLQTVGEDQVLYSFSENHLPTIAELAQIWSHADALDYWRTIVSFLENCEDEDRLYGQPLLQAVRNGLASFPSQGDAQKSCHSFCPCSFWRTGDFPAHGQECSRLNRLFALNDMQGYFSQFSHLCEVVGGRTEALSLERILLLIRQAMLSLLMFGYRQKEILSFLLFPDFQQCAVCVGHVDLQSLSDRVNKENENGLVHCGSEKLNGQQVLRFLQRSSLDLNTISAFRTYQRSAYPYYPPKNNCYVTNSRIIRIEKIKARDWFWDIHVQGNNNYITRDGTLHHNSGKTWVGCCGLAMHFWRHPLVNAGYFAPTYPQIRDIFYPTVEECFQSYGLSATIRTGANEVLVYSGKTYRGTIMCRSMDRPETIIGFKMGHALVDELDVMPPDKARLAWRKILARMRYNVPGLRNGVDVTTTPEGFRFVYEQFVKQVRENPELGKLYGIVKASTYDNAANLPEGYIDSLLQSYPAALIDAYINGEFVNLQSGTIYCAYNREDNTCEETIRAGEPLFIGMDFNVGRMAAVAHVKRQGLPCAVDEIVNAYDTPDMIQRIKERYWEYRGGTFVKTREIRIYPDASGESRRSVNASKTDLALLRDAGFIVCASASNPPVKDRINAMNAMFCNAMGERRYMVNPHTCPSYAEALEQQPWASNGEPDKTTGHDHINDAAGYFIVKEYPVIKNRVVSMNYTALR